MNNQMMNNQMNQYNNGFQDMNANQMMQQMDQNQMQQMYLSQMQTQKAIESGGGTPITAIRSDINQYNIPNNRQQPINKNAYHNNQYYQQQREYQNNADFDEYTDGNIKDLVNDINKDLDRFIPSRSRDTDDDDSDDTEKYIQPRKSIRQYIPVFAKEMMLILVLYVLLSQGFVKKAITKHITYLQPNQDGGVSMFGIVIYGTILSILYIIFKKILIS